MSKANYARCRDCGITRAEYGLLSWGGYCQPCYDKRRAANLEQMRSRSGPNFLKWRRSMAASVGGVLVDDVLPKA